MSASSSRLVPRTSSGLFFLSAVSAAVAIFLVFLALLSPVLHGNGLEWLLYILGATVIPLLACIYAQFLVKASARKRVDLSQFQALTAVLMALGTFIPVGVARAGLNSLFSLVALAVVIPILIIQLLLPAFLERKTSKVEGLGLVPSLSRNRSTLWLVAGSVLVLTVAVFAPHPNLTHASIASISLAVVLACLALGIGESTAERLPGMPFDLTVLAVLALILTSVKPPYDRFHYNFFIGPINDVVNGKLLLVDSFSQYGVLVINFLAAVMAHGPFGLSYEGLGVVVALLLFWEYGIIYFLLRLLTRSRVVPLAFIALLVLVNAYGQIGYPTSFPSVGPLRFLIPYVVLLLVALERHQERLRKWSAAGAALLVGVAAIWSFETFVYTAAAYAGIIVYEAASTRSLRRVAVRLVAASSCVALFHLSFALLTLQGGAGWPQWRTYLGLIGLYSVQGFGSLPVEIWSPWALVALIYLFSIIALVTSLLYGRAADDSEELPDLKVVSGLTLLGLATFSYFVGRSHPNNLRHVCIPAIVLFAYWLTNVRNATLPWAPRMKVVSLGLLALIIASLVITDEPAFAGKWRVSSLGSLVTAAAGSAGASVSHGPGLGQPQSDVVAKEAESLIEKYARDKRLIPALMNPDSMTEALLVTGKANAFPLNDPNQDVLISDKFRRLDRFGGQVKAGDYAFVEPADQLNSIEKVYLKDLTGSFRFGPADVSAHGVSAVMLLSKN